jgi:hypothetical protein
MIPLFSKAMDYHVERQFRKDRSGRLVFLPFGPKGKGYFVDSKSDEEKIRSFVKMFRSASALLSLLVFPTVYAPGLILNIYARMPLRNKLMTFAEFASLFLLLLIAVAWTLWAVYKETVPGLTSSLSEVGPDLKNQLKEVSSPPQYLQLLGLLCLLAGIILVGAAMWGAHYSHR